MLKVCVCIFEFQIIYRLTKSPLRKLPVNAIVYDLMGWHFLCQKLDLRTFWGHEIKMIPWKSSASNYRNRAENVDMSTILFLLRTQW